MKSNIEFDEALNEAGWKVLEFLQSKGEVSAAVFNNLKTALKIGIDEYLDLKNPKPEFKRDDRVVVNQTAGFNSGARGVVEYVEPSGKLWVLRDGSNSACYYLPTELDFE